MLKQVEPFKFKVVSPAFALTSANVKFWLPFCFILILAAGLRLYALDVYPQKFNQDEMVLGYDAWSVWTTGQDQHGNTWPIHFQTFNDSVPPLANYLTAPFVGMLGLSQFSTRLPFALLGIATVLLVGLLGRRWFGPGAGLVAALLLALEPWHLNYSRLAFPVSIVPFFTTLALYTFSRALNGLHRWPGLLKAGRRATLGWFATSALSFALLTSTYPALKLQAPLLLGACILVGLRLLWWWRWFSLGWLALYALAISPLAISQLLHWKEIQTHFSQLSVLDNPNWPWQFSLNYLQHFNPLSVFYSGYKGGVSIRPAGTGQLFWLEGLLWLAALPGLVRNRARFRQEQGFNLSLLLLLWFVSFPIAASLTDLDLPHEIRTYNFLPLPQLLAGYGAMVVWRSLSPYRFRRVALAQVVGVGGAALLVLFNLNFLSYFFGPPLLQTSTPPIQMPYNIGLEPVIRRVVQQARPCDLIWLEKTNQAYIYYLFLTRYPPRQFQQAEVKRILNSEGWIVIPWFEQVNFSLSIKEQFNPTPRPACPDPEPARLYYLSRIVTVGPEWQELMSVTTKNGSLVWRAVYRPL